MIFLWTDYCIYFFLFSVVSVTVRIASSARWAPVWRRMLYRPLNMVATLVLLVYAAIGVLDSFHWQTAVEEQSLYANGVISVLDKMLVPLSAHAETSYSAPFALYAFTREGGKTTPRLIYGGAHLSSPKEKMADITRRLGRVILETGLIFAAFAVVVLWGATRKHRLAFEVFWEAVIKGKTYFPWRTFFIAMGLLFFMVIFTHDFMPYYHILGTSQVGEDVLYQSLKSIRTALIVGTVTTLVMLPFAILFGISAGYLRGWVDDVVQYIYTTLSAIPGVLLIAAAVLTLQMVLDRHADWFQSALIRSDIRLLALCAILGITSWTGLCRLLRGEALKISQMDFVQAAHALGTSHTRIIFKHLLPNMMHIILISIALDFSMLVLAEAVLSYVGVGVDPTTYSWGTMINSARLELARLPVVWWSLTAAFFFMLFLVLAANIFSDAVRELFNPRSMSENNG